MGTALCAPTRLGADAPSYPSVNTPHSYLSRKWREELEVQIAECKYQIAKGLARTRGFLLPDRVRDKQGRNDMGVILLHPLPERARDRFRKGGIWGAQSIVPL